MKNPTSSSASPATKHRAPRLTGGRAVVAAAALLSAVTAGTVTGPGMAHDLDQAAQARSSSDRIQKQLDRVDLAQRDPRAGSELKRLRQQIPADADLGTFTASLQQAAESAGAHWVSSSEGSGSDTAIPRLEVPGSEARGYRVMVTLDADADAAAAFVANVQKGPRLVRVESLDVSGEHAEVSFTVFALAADPSGQS